MSQFTSESGIYVIMNIKNGKSYIGSAINLKVRIRRHKRDLKNNTHHNPKLQNSYNKHGKQFFIFCLVEIVTDEKKLISTEQYWIDLYDSYHNGYNCNPTAGSGLGFKQSEETKAKRRGKKHSEETKAKMSETRKQYFKDHPEARENIAEFGKKRVISDKTRLKMSNSAKELWRIKKSINEAA